MTATAPTPSAELRSRLYAERDSLRERMKALSGGLHVEQVAESMEAISNQQSRDQAAGELKRLRNTAADVEVAISRWTLGCFGECATCDGPISAARLNAVPWAANCLRCQARAERRGE